LTDAHVSDDLQQLCIESIHTNREASSTIDVRRHNWQGRTWFEVSYYFDGSNSQTYSIERSKPS
jgi:hypothetical protein